MLWRKICLLELGEAHISFCLSLQVLSDFIIQWAVLGLFWLIFPCTCTFPNNLQPSLWCLSTADTNLNLGLCACYWFEESEETTRPILLSCNSLSMMTLLCDCRKMFKKALCLAQGFIRLEVIWTCFTSNSLLWFFFFLQCKSAIVLNILLGGKLGL